MTKILPHLTALEAESFHVMREVVAQFERPVLLSQHPMPSRLRVLSFVFKPYAGEVYGGERSLAAMLSQCESIDSIVVVNQRDEFAELLDQSGIPSRFVPGHDPLTGFRDLDYRGKLRRLRDWGAINAAFARIVREERPDVVHLNDIVEPVVVAPALMTYRGPVVTHIRSEVRMRPRHKAILAASTATVSVSHAISRAHLSQLPAALDARARRRARVIHNGIDLEAVDHHVLSCDRAAVRDGLGLSGEDVVVLVVGSMEERKGQLQLVRDILPGVLADVPNVRVLLAGGEKSRGESAAYARSVREAVAELGLADRVHLLGFRTDVYDLLHACDILALPSRIEGLPRAVLEANAFSRPSVAYAVSGTPEAVRDGISGCLVMPDDTAGFGQALRSLAESPGLRERMGSEAGQLARERFDARRCAREIEAVFRAVSNGSSGP